MNLTTRLNLFFLTALAIVLAGFSIALQVFASRHLHRQADDRLDAALNVLTAAAEVSSEGVEWEPAERRMALGTGAAGDAVVWLVSDPAGHVLDRTVPENAVDFLSEVAGHLQANQRAGKRFDWQGERWQFRQQWVETTDPKSSAQSHSGENEKKFPAIGITVGTSLEPVRSTLRELTAVLVGLSLTIWFAALLAGRAICRRALRPLTRMADAARAMDATALDRLPLCASGDELEELGRAFNGLLERVRDAFERQRRFTGEASHQLRTPLAALLGQVEVALRRDRPGEEYRRVLGSVRQQADRLQRIVESLLFLARADAETRLPDRERIDLAVWLTDYLAAGAERPRASDVVVHARSAWADVHPVLLGELLNVLLDNARQHSPPGSPVTIRLDRTEQEIELSVTDVGCGIPDDDLPHLFEPFFRSPDARLRGIEGFGLGLSVAKRIADAFGGTLTVASRLGQGTRFTLRLPVPRVEGCIEAALDVSPQWGW